MDSGGIPDDWKPLPPPPIGSLRWKRDVVERSIRIVDHERNTVYDYGSVDRGGVGVFCIKRTSGGWNYFWADDIRRINEIDWLQIEHDHIAGK